MLTWLMYGDCPQWLFVKASNHDALATGLARYLIERKGLAVKDRN